MVINRCFDGMHCVCVLAFFGLVNGYDTPDPWRNFQQQRWLGVPSNVPSLIPLYFPDGSGRGGFDRSNQDFARSYEKDLYLSIFANTILSGNIPELLTAEIRALTPPGATVGPSAVTPATDDTNSAAAPENAAAPGASTTSASILAQVLEKLPAVDNAAAGARPTRAFEDHVAASQFLQQLHGLLPPGNFQQKTSKQKKSDDTDSKDAKVQLKARGQTKAPSASEAAAKLVRSTRSRIGCFVERSEQKHLVGVCEAQTAVGSRCDGMMIKRTKECGPTMVCCARL
ncbi:hypothetical protein BV898_07328 [Hypsibius exemplaris]|uniref:Uncharacterized protein n=1 Tax=Hypsibius exemplaris TaxID=2072580 RepID=A0A1W0WU15_HYPEX|nr:hypothetical protein BV898_07328 [Hypsibius exemplaris]